MLTLHMLDEVLNPHEDPFLALGRLTSCAQDAVVPPGLVRRARVPCSRGDRQRPPLALPTLEDLGRVLSVQVVRDGPLGRKLLGSGAQSALGLGVHEFVTRSDHDELTCAAFTDSGRFFSLVDGWSRSVGQRLSWV